MFNDLSAAPQDAAISSKPGYLDSNRAAKACTWVFACPMLGSSIISSMAIPIRPTNFSMCMNWLSGQLPANRAGISVQSQLLLCVATASSCAAALQCMPWEELADGDPRCAPDAGDPNGCIDDGFSVLRCDDREVLHCRAANWVSGSRCLVGLDGTRECAVSDNCADPHDTCSETLHDYCDATSGLHQIEDCSVPGKICGTDQPSNVSDCLTRTTVERCGTFDAVCDGALLEACDAWSLSIFDCAAMGGTCSMQGGDAHCVRAADQCSAFDANINVCDGAKISLCIDGAVTSYDCGRIGAHCAAATGGQTAHCEL